MQIFFPSDHPILGIDPESVPGWTDTIVTSALNPPVTTDDGTISSYVSEVTWSGGPIAVGHFMEFHVLAQTLPSDTDQVAFKALANLCRRHRRSLDRPSHHCDSEPRSSDADPSADGRRGWTPRSSAEPSSSIAASEQPRASGGSTASGSSKNNILSVVALIVGLVGVAIGTVGLVVARRRPTVNPLSP